jgi:hypothetical protein
MSCKRIAKGLVGSGEQAITRYKPAQGMHSRRKSEDSSTDVCNAAKQGAVRRPARLETFKNSFV